MANAEKMQVLNEALFSGTIVSIRGEKTNGSLVIACPLITSARRQGAIENGVRVNFPSLIFNKDTKTENILEKFKRGDHVTIKAHAQSYIRLDENTGDTKEIMSLYIDEIDMEESKMFNMFGKEGRTYSAPQNEVYLSGILAGVTKRTENILSIRLDLSQSKRNYLNATYFRAPAGIASELKIGDKVDVLAMVQTVNTKEQKKARTYQELIILDISTD